MDAVKSFKVKEIVPGRASGPALVTRERVSFHGFIDHLMITTDALPDYGTGETVLLSLDLADPTYVGEMSDHRPVMAKFRPAAH